MIIPYSQRNNNLNSSYLYIYFINLLIHRLPHVFQMLEVMFQHTPSTRYDRVGRNTFYSCVGEFGPQLPLGGGKEGTVGFFSSVRPVQWKDGSLLLNIDSESFQNFLLRVSPGHYPSWHVFLPVSFSPSFCPWYFLSRVLSSNVRSN